MSCTDNFCELRDKVREYLVGEGLGPGDQIAPETVLAERFSVKRAKIREILASLCQEGILSRKAGSGTVIEPFDMEKAGEHLKFRFQLAGFDSADAAEARRTVELAMLPLVIKRITPSVMRRLEETIEEMARLKDSPKEADRFDREFHLILLEATGNRTLQAFAGVIEMLFRSELRDRYFVTEMVDRAVDEHRQLLTALKSENLDDATLCLREHLSPR